MGDHNGVVMPPKSDQIALRKGLYLCLFIFFAISCLSLNTSVAAPTATKPQKTQNPKVMFNKGLLTVQAKDVRLKALMEEIGKKTGVGVSVAENLQKKKVSVQFEDLTLETELKVIL